MTREPIASSMFTAVGFEDGVLEVQYANGGVYQASGVPESVHAALVSSDSPGKFFNANLRNKYTFTKIG